MKRATSLSVAAKDPDVSSDEEENHWVNKVLLSQYEDPARRPRMSLQRYCLGQSFLATGLHSLLHIHNLHPLICLHKSLLWVCIHTHAFSLYPLYSARVRRMRPFPLRAARRIGFSRLGENDLVCEPVDIMPSEGLGNEDTFTQPDKLEGAQRRPETR